MEAKAFEAMVTLLKEHSATNSLLFAELKELRRQIQGNTGPATPTMPATAAPKVKKKVTKSISATQTQPQNQAHLCCEEDGRQDKIKGCEK